MRQFVPASSLVLLTFLATALPESAHAQSRALDALTARRAARSGSSRVIIVAADAQRLPAALDAVQRAGGRVGRALPLIHAHVADLPNAALRGLARNPFVAAVTVDRTVAASLERTAATVGAAAVRRDLAYDGSGIGVAIIDSGVAPSHDDLADAGVQRVDGFVDFVNGRTDAYDDFGHGTHVAGIVAGNGFDSEGARAGIAPGARVIALKVLDRNGTGRISDVIAALDYVVSNRDALNIRVVNLSIATGVYESPDTDPLTLAAKRAVEAGIVVVAAAGNYGRDQQGRLMYGGITAPGNAPWVLTVGASSHMGTIDRTDDTVAAFSSRGPTAVRALAKPDLVAPGVGIESLTDPSSSLYATNAPYLLPGTVPTPYLPYLSLSGTSMSAPVVAGTVALMLQANPALTPNAVKAILQFTAQADPDVDPLTQGVGFLNADGAVRLARFFANPSADRPSSPDWSGRIIWGTRMVGGGRLTATANAWSPDVTWGATLTPAGAAIAWGDICRFDQCGGSPGQWTRWRITCPDNSCADGQWSNGFTRNVVWGSRCGGADCADTWALGLFGASDSGDTVVWGTNGDGDTVVWGTNGGGDTVVWGTTGDGDTVVWGTTCADLSCVPVVWKP